MTEAIVSNQGRTAGSGLCALPGTRPGHPVRMARR